MRRDSAFRCSVFVVLVLAICVQWRLGSDDQSSPDPAISREMLTAHNLIRARIPVPPLRWSDHLSVQAQQWADHLLQTNEFAHRPNPVFGENLYKIAGTVRASPLEVVTDWAFEAHDYSHETNACRAMCGHYTQIVWSDTREVGCAVARDPHHEIWVCEYDPPGNWVGERPY